MDWIETWLGFSPDGGDGSLETLLVALLATAACAAFLGFTRRGRVVLRRAVSGIAKELRTANRG